MREAEAKRKATYRSNKRKQAAQREKERKAHRRPSSCEKSTCTFMLQELAELRATMEATRGRPVADEVDKASAARVSVGNFRRKWSLRPGAEGASQHQHVTHVPMRALPGKTGRGRRGAARTCCKVCLKLVLYTN